MSKKSVVIAMPQRPSLSRPVEPREADVWVSDKSSANGLIDLTAPRNPFELAMLIWTFPALATLHWMAKVMGQPRPR